MSPDDEVAIASLQWELISESCRICLSTDLDFEQPPSASENEADDAADAQDQSGRPTDADAEVGSVPLAKFSTSAKLVLLEALRDGLERITVAGYPADQKAKGDEVTDALTSFKKLLDVVKPLASEVHIAEIRQDLKRLNDAVTAFRANPLTKKLANLRLSEWVIKSADDMGAQLATFEKNRGRMLQVVSRVKIVLSESSLEEDRKAVAKTEFVSAPLAGVTRHYKELILEMKKLEAVGGAVLVDVAEYQDQRQKMLARGEHMLGELQRQYTVRVARCLGEWIQRLGLFGRQQCAKAAKTLGEKLVACVSKSIENAASMCT